MRVTVRIGYREWAACMNGAEREQLLRKKQFEAARGMKPNIWRVDNQYGGAIEMHPGDDDLYLTVEGEPLEDIAGQHREEWATR